MASRDVKNDSKSNSKAVESDSDSEFEEEYDQKGYTDKQTKSYIKFKDTDSNTDNVPYSIHAYHQHHKGKLDRRETFPQRPKPDINATVKCLICKVKFDPELEQKRYPIVISKHKPVNVSKRAPVIETGWNICQGSPKTWNPQLTHLKCFASIDDDNFPLFR
jgi:hypothetical protein